MEGLSDIREPRNLSLNDTTASSIYDWDNDGIAGVDIPDLDTSVASNPGGIVQGSRPNTPPNSAYCAQNRFSPTGLNISGDEGLFGIRQPGNQVFNDSNASSLYEADDNGLVGIGMPDFNTSVCSNPGGNIQGSRPNTPLNSGYYAQNRFSPTGLINISGDEGLFGIRQPRNLNDSNASSRNDRNGVGMPDYNTSVCSNPRGNIQGSRPNTPQRQNTSSYDDRNMISFSPGGLNMSGQGMSDVGQAGNLRSPMNSPIAANAGNTSRGQSPQRSPYANAPNSRNVSPSQMAYAQNGVGNNSMGGAIPFQNLENPSGGMDESACFQTRTRMGFSPPGAYAAGPVNTSMNQSLNAGNISRGQSPQRSPNANAPNSRSVSPSQMAYAANGVGNNSMGGAIPFQNLENQSGGMDDSACFRPSTKMMSSPPGANVYTRSPINSPIAGNAGNISRGQSPQRSPNANAPNSRSVSPSQMAYAPNGAGNITMGGTNAFQNSEKLWCGGMDESACFRPSTKMMCSPPGANVYARSPVNSPIAANAGNISRSQSPQRSPVANASNSRSVSPRQMAYSPNGAGNTRQAIVFQIPGNQLGGMDADCMIARPKMAFSPPVVYAAQPVNTSMNQSANGGNISNRQSPRNIPNGANVNGGQGPNCANVSPGQAYDGAGNISLRGQPQNVSQNASLMGQPDVNDLSFLGRNVFENPANVSGMNNDLNNSPGLMVFSPTPLMEFSPKRAVAARGNSNMGAPSGPFRIEDMLSDAGFHDRLRQTVQRQVGDVFTINVVLRDSPDSKCPCPKER